MKRLSKRGEVITVGVITVAVVVGILGFALGASGLRKWIPGFGGKENKTQKVTISKTESKPVFVTAPDGKQYVLQSTSSQISNSEMSEEQKTTLWQKLMFLPKLWLLLMILGIFFPPVALLMGVLNQKLFGHLKKIVGGVEESLKTLPDSSPEKTKILDTLSKKYDGSTKALVSKVKRTL